MSKNFWFRMYSEAVDDDKLRLLDFEDRWHFVAILCCKTQGVLDCHPETLERRVAVKLGLQLRDAGEVKRRLMEVDLVDENWQPVNWDKRQPPSDIDPTNSERQRRFREKKRQEKSETQEKSTSSSEVTDSNGVTVTKITALELELEQETEKMGAGCPIVCSVEGEAAQLVKRSGAGICIEPENVSALIQAIEELRQDPQRRRQLSRNGQEFVRAHYSRESLAEKYLEALCGRI